MRFHPLDDATRERFERDGYLIIRGAIPRTQVDELVAASDRLLAAGGDDGRAPNGPSQDGFRNAVSLDPAIARLATVERTLSWMTQLLSPGIQLHTSQLIYKSPEPSGTDPRALNPGWHRDITPLPEDLGDDGNQRVEIKAAYYLSPGNAANGVTMVARGSHRWRARPALGADGDPPETVVPELEPGDALLFENRTWHAARVNTSAITRKCIILGYSYRWMRPDDWVEQRPEVLGWLDEIGRELLTSTTRRDERGRFTLAPSNPRMVEWAREHGAVSAAAYRREHQLIEAA